MTVTVLISVMGHVVVVGIFNYLLELPSPYFLCLRHTPQLAVVLYWWGDPDLHS